MIFKIEKLLLLTCGYFLFTGMVSSSLFPTMGYLVDIRQLPSYADAYALADACLCLGFLIGKLACSA